MYFVKCYKQIVIKIIYYKKHSYMIQNNKFVIQIFYVLTLIKSISGIRGTIGGKPGDGLSPIDIVKFTAAFGVWIKNHSKAKKNKVVIGRDARISGELLIIHHFQMNHHHKKLNLNLEKQLQYKSMILVSFFSPDH